MLRAIVVGRSSSVLGEYAAACELCDFDLTIVVGKMGEIFPDPIDHWVSFHANLFPHWCAVRQAAGLGLPGKFWGGKYRGRNLYKGPSLLAPIDYVETIGGSSGFMAAVQVAYDKLGADKIVMAGIPLEAGAGHLTQASAPVEVGKPWNEAGQYWATWEEHMPRLLGRIKSMSGRTRQALGEPTAAWLQE